MEREEAEKERKRRKRRKSKIKTQERMGGWRLFFFLKLLQHAQRQNKQQQCVWRLTDDSDFWR